MVPPFCQVQIYEKIEKDAYVYPASCLRVILLAPLWNLRPPSSSIARFFKIKPSNRF